MSQEVEFACQLPDGTPFRIFTEYDETEECWYAGTHFEHRGEIFVTAPWREAAIYDLVAQVLHIYPCGRVPLDCFTDLTRRHKLVRRRGEWWFKRTLDLTEGKPKS